MSYISTERGTIGYFGVICAFPDAGTLEAPQSDNLMCCFCASVGRGRRLAQSRTYLGMDHLPPLAQVLLFSACFLSAFPSSFYKQPKHLVHLLPGSKRA